MAVVIGRKGLIGSEISKLIFAEDYPSPNTDVIYDCGSPTHLAFEKNLEHHTNQAIQRLLTLLPYCKKHDIKYVFPSTALIYEREIPFTAVKMACESLIKASGTRYLIVRLWPVYGNEAHKGKYASVVYKWRQQIKNEEAIEIYGDGKQKRAFISAEEVARNLITDKEGIYDLAGEEKTFNQIAKELGAKKIKYIPAPEGYSLISPKPENPL